MRRGIYRHAILEFDSSATQSDKFDDKLLLHEIEDSKSKPSWQIEVSVLNSSAARFCLYQSSVDMQEASAKFFSISEEC